MTIATIKLDGFNLSIEQLATVANAESPSEVQVTLCDHGLNRLIQGRKVVDHAIARNDQVYGLTTGLGSQVTQTLSADELSSFSYQTLRGRAHAIGKPLTPAKVRGAMLVRLNTLLKGHGGANLAIAKTLQGFLNANVTPVIGDIGSIGASDLCWGATMGLSLIGEGRIINATGQDISATTAYQLADIPPLKLGPKDGLVLANHSSFSAALMALAIHQGHRLMQSMQASTAVTMEAFVANTTPLLPLTSAVRPQMGQQQAGEQLIALLAGSQILDHRRARRLQDPLSFRNVVQVHGAAIAVLDFCNKIATDEINGASDNPVVDIDQDQIVSCGAYHTPLLTIAAQSLSSALVQVAHTTLARISKLVSAKFTALPQYLAAPGANSNGFAPVLKIAEAVVAELTQAAAATPVWPSVNADGAEDIQTNAATAIKALERVIGFGEQLCAIELMIAAQAFELREISQPGDIIVQIVKEIRRYSDPLTQDRPLGTDITTLSEAVTAGAFARFT